MTSVPTLACFSGTRVVDAFHGTWHWIEVAKADAHRLDPEIAPYSDFSDCWLRDFARWYVQHRVGRHQVSASAIEEAGTLSCGPGE
jgi:hypothetical protein